MSDQRQSSTFLRLRHSLQLLACPAETQLDLLPYYVCRSDELALEFDHWRMTVSGLYRSELTDVQLSALIVVDEHLKTITAWSDDDIKTSGEWAMARRLARQALDAFAWPMETPPSYAHEYVPVAPRSSSSGERS